MPEEVEMESAAVEGDDAVEESSGTSGRGGMRRVKVIPLQHPTPSDVPSFGSSVSSLWRKWRSKLESTTSMEWLGIFLPCSVWIRTYKWKKYLRLDLISGITVGVMLIPQSMSYAKLAGLHPIYGLYSGFVPIFMYAIFGSSRQVAIGPVALVSLLVSNVLEEIVSPSDELYTKLAILLAFMVGVMECAMGLLRLGWILRFVSHSVISGFTTSSAIIIGLSQAKYFLGYEVERSNKIIPLMQSIIGGAHKFKWPPFLMGFIILTILLAMKHLGKSIRRLRFLRAAGPLTAVILGIVFMKIFNPSSIPTVGKIPQGLPNFSSPVLFGHVKSLIPTAFLITGVAILESVGIAKALAAKNGYELNSNQELFGLGIANVCGSFFSSYPSTGSFSRSAVNHESGAKTGLSGITMGIIITCTLLFLTPIFEGIPQCVLAAIVVSAVTGLVDYSEAWFLWRVNKKDFLLWTITSITTLFLGIEIGVLIGVGFSLAFIIQESANPHMAVLGRLPGTTIYRNTEQYPDSYIYNGIVIVRIDAPIYFANTSYIKDRLRKFEGDKSGPSNHGPEVENIYFVILEMAPVTYMDSSAVQALKELHLEYKSRGIQVDRLRKEGYYGGVRLLMALCKEFFEYCSNNKIELHDQNFTLSYETNIPRQTGLSGSSAIVCAALNCLLDFYKVRHLIKVEIRPQVILNAEKELGIVAGLQDRVVQVYGGLVFMDFNKKFMEEKGHGRYTPMDVNLLPRLYLIYAENPSDSGKVHSSVRQKWLDGDKFIISKMEEVAVIASECRKALLENDSTQIANLMNRNFDIRRQMFGDCVLGSLNLKMIDVARSVGAACKFTGSGGAVVALCPEGPDQAKLLKDACKEAGFIMEPIKTIPSLV